MSYDGCTTTAPAYVTVAATNTAGVFIDWGGDGFAAGSYDAITLGDIISWVITRGAAPEITGGAQPGSATIVLKNPNDIYNARNLSSPLVDQLRDGTPIWIGVADDGTLTGTPVNGLFGGRITDITLLPAGGATKSPTVEFVCEDALGWYQRIPIRIGYTPLLAGKSQAYVRAAALTQGGESRTNLAHEITTLPAPHYEGSLLGVLGEINAANGTRHWAEPADLYTDWYTYRTRNRQWRLDATSDASVSASSNHVTGTSGWRLSADTVTNQQKATVIPLVFTPDTTTVWQVDQLPITLTDAAHWVRIVSFDNLVAHATLNIANTGNTVNYTLTDFGTGMKIDLWMSPGESAVITALSVQGSMVREAEAQSYVAEDLTSQAGPRGIRAAGDIAGVFVGTIDSGIGIAKHVVWRYGDPQLRPTITVENWFPTMFQLDLYDVISFTSTELGMTNRLFEIVGLTHISDVAAATVKHHIVTYVLQEAKVQTDPGWFVLNSSLLDGPKVLAY